MINEFLDTHESTCYAWHISTRQEINDVRASHFRLLDLYCGEGLAAWGYWRSGSFSEIVGVDIDPAMSSRYAFNFICRDVLTLDYDFLSQFDFIHASPPCQGYSDMTPAAAKDKHLKLIPATKQMLYASGKPHVIENVPGAKKALKPNIVMNGLFFGLKSDRPRYFYSSTLSSSIRLIKPGRGIVVHGGDYLSLEKLRGAFGLPNMIGDHRLKLITRTGIEQGVPPAMTMALACLLKLDRFMIA